MGCIEKGERWAAKQQTQKSECLHLIPTLLCFPVGRCRPIFYALFFQYISHKWGGFWSDQTKTLIWLEKMTGSLFLATLMFRCYSMCWSEILASIFALTESMRILLQLTFRMSTIISKFLPFFHSFWWVLGSQILWYKWWRVIRFAIFIVSPAL